MGLGKHIFCLVIPDGVITEELSNLMFDTAQEMFASKTAEMRVKSDRFEGVIKTGWKTARIGFVSGYVFTIDVEIENHRVRSDYIVRESDLRSKDGFWGIADMLGNDL